MRAFLWTSMFLLLSAPRFLRLLLLLLLLSLLLLLLLLLCWLPLLLSSRRGRAHALPTRRCLPHGLAPQRRPNRRRHPIDTSTVLGGARLLLLRLLL